MSSSPPAAVIGCLLDVSGSMREALEAGSPDEQAAERLRAVLNAALKVAQAEQRHNPKALVFVGVFGLDTDKGCPPVVDLCGAADALLQDPGADTSGHDLLVARANRENLAHITKYIQKKLTDDEARIVDAHLGRHPEQVREFVEAIPSEKKVRSLKNATRYSGSFVGIAGAVSIGVVTGAGIAALVGGAVVGAASGGATGDTVAANKEAEAVENSEALHIARRICAEWLQDFTILVPRPVGDVVALLKRLQKRSKANVNARQEQTEDSTVFDTLRRYMYGRTPMRDALSRSLDAFNQHPDAKRRVLVLVSDGFPTDGDPLSLAGTLKEANVSMATVFLTRNEMSAPRRLYFKAAEDWNSGQCILFNMASRVSGVTHPIPVLTSVGWDVPWEGEVALYATVSSSTALDEFCSLLLSARFGSADALLDIMGRISHDSFINDEHVKKCRDPSDQNQSGTCYAHATAATIHMALVRIVGREGGYPTVEEIRKHIEQEFPPNQGGHNTEEVLKAAARWYRPLQVRKVDEIGARQAVLRRRPVLARFRLSEPGWNVFEKHFKEQPDRPLRLAQMAAHRSQPVFGGHAVVLTSCNPDSLTFLNSWGYKWGNNGSFSIEDHTVLGLERYPMNFYNVYWFEHDLTPAERQAYIDKADKTWHCRVTQYPSILELEVRCPYCQTNTALAKFRIRRVECPQCTRAFTLEARHVLEAL